MQHTIADLRTVPSYSAAAHKPSAWTRFIQWATEEEKTHHLGWVGAALTVQACVLFPGTMLAVLANGASFVLIMVAMVSLTTVAIVNLAALSTRYTIPVFFLSILINAGVIIASFFS